MGYWLRGFGPRALVLARTETRRLKPTLLEWKRLQGGPLVV